MGVIIQARKFSPQNQTGLLKPIVFCCPYEGVTEGAVSLNKELAQVLMTYRPERRTMLIEMCFREMIAELPEGVILKDFDVLFNPDYKVDVMKIMVNACKGNPFSIIWPGTFDGERLVYAQEGYQDYRRYAIDDYDITCIV